MKDLLLTLKKTENTMADFRCITENIDTSTPEGRMMMQIVGTFAEFERAMLRERTKNELAAARLFQGLPSTVVRLLARHRMT